MSTNKHKEYNIEKERLEFTVGYMNKIIDATDKHKTLYKSNIKQAMTELDHLDSSLSYINVLINTQFLEVAEKNYENYKKARTKPYFARIDFKTKDEGEEHKIYIGKISLIEAETNKVLVVDWRSPIATLYYEGRLGDTYYEAEGVVHDGELLLKRQFLIEDAKLKNILDIDITTTDTFLQASLEANAESRLKDIATTIQAEQNKVIRAAMNKPLIVQGVAGSGKTTIALHRIAYFIYTYEETFEPENFLIIAPNNLFINYISEVLPELGVEKVKQSTFVDFIGGLIGGKYKLSNSEEKLVSLIQTTNKDDRDIEYMKWASAFKGTMVFKDIIDGFVQEIEQNFMPVNDFSLFDQVLINNSEIRKMFLEDLKYLPIHKRSDEIEKSLKNKLKHVKKDILKDIEVFYDKQIDFIRENNDNLEIRRKKIVELIEERDEKLKKYNSEMKVVVKKYLRNFPQKTLFQYYEELIISEDNIKKFSNINLENDKISYFCSHSKNLLENKCIELEDYAALVYLKHRLFGFEKKIEIESVVIDEAQDFSLFQFYALKTVLNTNMITLLGDLSQGIHSYRAINNWQEVIDKVFGEKDSNYKTLVQSYRTTIEVMTLANEVIKKLNNEGIVLAKPVIRHGGKPEKIMFQDEKQLILSIEEKITELKKQKFKSIAIICKTTEECKKIKKQLDKSSIIEAMILDEKQQEYKAGVIIVPSNLAKGLEFDVVFIANINEKYYNNELDIKLLYVAMTRTLHKLFIYYKKETLPLLDSISNEFYTVI